MAEQKQLPCGKLGRPHGLRGELRFFPYNPDSSVFAALTHGTMIVGTSKRDVHIERVVQHGSAFILRVRELRNREDAAQWTHAELWISTDVFPELENENEWYYYQLEGLRAVDADGQPVGVVHAVQNYGAGDILVIHGAQGECDIPLMAPWVGDVNLEQGTIVVDMGWMDA